MRLTAQYESFLFIADYHALTALRDGEKMREYTRDVAATWLACGLDPSAVHLYRQSDVTEVFELSWVLACMVATGQLERGVSYKEARDRGESPNAGVFTYPVLMAADILLYDADVVPVGRDQLQHIEVARDMAARFNHSFGGELLRVPEPRITDAPLVPGLDGQKMSKSKGNSIPLFAPPKKLRKVVMKIVTASDPLEAPTEAAGSTVFELYKLVATEAQCQEMQDNLRRSDYGWGHAKQALYEALEAELGPRREVYDATRADTEGLDRLLQEGADRARPIARATMNRVRRAVGMAVR